MKVENAFGFEGFEKRLEVEFEAQAGQDKSSHTSGNGAGLRSLSRCELDEMLTAAECTIVSERHNTWFDSYVLSESSLFVYPRRLILKTCGKTQLLNAVPFLLRQATALSLKAARCKYSRGTFIFPDAQPFPYTSFTEETRVLDELFAPMIVHGCRSAHVLNGHPDSSSSSWHIYTAMAAKEYATPPIAAEVHINTSPNMSMGAEESVKAFTDVATAVVDCAKSSFPSPMLQRPFDVYTLEMCMTHLDPVTSSHFMNLSGCKSGADMTHKSGVSFLLPNADICDFAFTPCGYSMNGMEADALSTIHVTPEEGHSYASFEVMGYDPHSLDLGALVNRVVACFKPGSLVMSIHASGYGKSRLGSMPSSWDTSNVVPQGYVCNISVRQGLAGDGVVTFHSFTKGFSAGRRSVIPKRLQSHGGHGDEWQIDTSCEPAFPFGNPDNGDDDDCLSLPCLTKKSRSHSLLPLEDITPKMAAGENNTERAERACCAGDSYSGNHVAYPHRELRTHQPLQISYGSVKYCGALLTIVDSEMELFRLRECNPNAKVILRLGTKSKGSHMELQASAKEMLRKTTKLGLQVMGMVVGTAMDSSLTVCGKGTAIKGCGSVVQDMGMGPPKLLAMAASAATSPSYE